MSCREERRRSSEWTATGFLFSKIQSGAHQQRDRIFLVASLFHDANAFAQFPVKLTQVENWNGSDAGPREGILPQQISNERCHIRLLLSTLSVFLCRLHLCQSHDSLPLSFLLPLFLYILEPRQHVHVRHELVSALKTHTLVTSSRPTDNTLFLFLECWSGEKNESNRRL